MGDVLWDALATFTCGCLCGGFDATTDGFALLWLGLVWTHRDPRWGQGWQGWTMLQREALAVDGGCH